MTVLCASSSAQAKRLGALARSFARSLKLSDCELSLSLVRDRAIRELKREYFGIDAATDVLSFPAGEFAGGGLRPLGDIVISLDTARRAAIVTSLTTNTARCGSTQTTPCAMQWISRTTPRNVRATC